MIVGDDSKRKIRTIVIATIGSLQHYFEHPVDIDGSTIDKVDLTYDNLIAKFHRYGADVIRINLSHLTPRDAEAVFSQVRRAVLSARKVSGKPLTILVDLMGPKIRFDYLDIPAEIGDTFIVDLAGREPGGFGHTLYVDELPFKQALEQLDSNFPDQSSDKPRFDIFIESIKERLATGDRPLAIVGDSTLIMEIVALEPQHEPIALSCRILTARNRHVRGRRGFVVVGVNFDIPTFSSYEESILAELLRAESGTGLDETTIGIISIAFTQRKEDVLRAREFIESTISKNVDNENKLKEYRKPLVIAKIESSRALENLSETLDVADGIMISRGDLALQVNVEDVPALQENVIARCKQRGKLIIAATQMLSSMVSSIEPTRGEVINIYHEIRDGVDAVMLSEETAIGQFPFHALQKIVLIASRAEKAGYYSCFISYSHKDRLFARHLYDHLQMRGVQCWLDEHQLLPGDDIHDMIDKGIRLGDKVLLCCSEASLTSWWVHSEIESTLEKERHLSHDQRNQLGGRKLNVLIPLDLDGYVFSDRWRSGKAAIIRSRFVARFVGWQHDRTVFKRQFDLLLEALRTETLRT